MHSCQALRPIHLDSLFFFGKSSSSPIGQLRLVDLRGTKCVPRQKIMSQSFLRLCRKSVLAFCFSEDTHQRQNFFSIIVREALCLSRLIMMRGLRFPAAQTSQRFLTPNCPGRNWRCGANTCLSEDRYEISTHG